LETKGGENKETDAMRAGNYTQKPQQRHLWAWELVHLAVDSELRFYDKAKKVIG
jgi:hypothetical protein